MRNELTSELPTVLGKLLRLAQLEQQRQYSERSGKRSKSPAAELAEDLPARISAAHRHERKAEMPAAELFHAAFTRARAEGLIEADVPAGASAGVEGEVVRALSTGFVVPPADFEKSGRPISRPYWDAIRKFPFHWPLDLPIGDGSDFEWEDDPMPRFASYELMIQKDDTFAWWAKEARKRFANLSMLIGMMRETRRNDDEEVRQWANHEYTEIIGSTEAEVPDENLARLLGGDYNILIDDERLRIWWNWAECHWAIAGFLSQRHGYHTADDPFDDDLIATWLFLLVGRRVLDEWSQPAWLRRRLFDWRQLPLFAAPVPAVRLIVPKGALTSSDLSTAQTG